MTSSIDGGSAPISARRALALLIILAAQLMLCMDLLIVVVALPRIEQDLGFTPAALTWVLNAFGLAFGGLLLLGGRLGDMIGQVRAFRTGIVIFVAASLLGSLAPTAAILVVARVLQGIGAALAGPSVLALVMVTARDADERASGLSLFIAVSSIGASTGLILGGVLTEFLSWRWSLLINVPIGAVVVTAIGKLVKETHPKKAHLDVGGALTATLGSVALVYGFIGAADHGWTSAGTIGSFVIAAAMIVTFFRIECRHAEPLLDLNLVRNRSRLGGLAVMALIVGVHFAVLFMLVQYLQRELHYAPLDAGLAYLPLTMTVFVISHFVPRMLGRFGPRSLLVSGSVLVAASLVGFAFLGPDDIFFPSVVVPLLVHAAGIALVFAPGTVAIMDGVPDEHAGSASGLLQMDQQIGGALGIAVIASIYTFAVVPGEYTSGLPAAFGSGAAIALISAVAAWFCVRNPNDTDRVVHDRKPDEPRATECAG
ncbi:MFS transporter [Neorhizobium sp. JUb45]|uniref:MFS transporter n=1 Tax=Neorhizobium sp. JUb45 TaxID=2485113 RepID=UPI0010429FD3|nr:MFS transporter [Neorhizobium sp. JUb45]TCQ97170.1 EmrB/QacA subfamily drug resistance transporter [Neorhizobium sp. JUb45]